MALITRISRLFKADFHAVLDQIEEPEALLRQAIREMEESLTQADLEQRVKVDEKRALQMRCGELDRALADIDEELDICFESDKDELAHDLVRRKLEKQRLLKRISTTLEAADEESVRQQRVLEENRVRLEGMRQKLEVFTERAPSSSANHIDPDNSVWHPSELQVNDSDVEVAFLREKKRRTQS